MPKVIRASAWNWWKNHRIFKQRFDSGRSGKGSLGASGDLAPLSHMALPLLGLGEVYYQGKLMPAEEALKLAGIQPLSHLEAKEGLSLINGTQVMTAIGAMVYMMPLIWRKWRILRE